MFPPLSHPGIGAPEKSGTGEGEGTDAQVTCRESITMPERNTTRIESRGRFGEGPM